MIPFKCMPTDCSTPQRVAILAVTSHFQLLGIFFAISRVLFGFFGAFADVPKKRLLASSSLSVHLSFLMERLGSHRKDFHEM